MSLFNQLTFGVGAQFKTIFNLNAAVYICHAGPFLSDKFFDLTGSCSYAIAALQGYFSRIKQQQRLGKKKSEVEKGNLRAGIATAGVLIWAIRLGTFLFTRISRDGVDSRQDSFPVQVNRVWTDLEDQEIGSSKPHYDKVFQGF